MRAAAAGAAAALGNAAQPTPRRPVKFAQSARRQVRDYAFRANAVAVLAFCAMAEDGRAA